MKISAQKHIIEAILDALETNIHALGIAQKCEISTGESGVTYFISLVPKQENEISARDWFWLGYFVREYMD